MVGGAGEGVLGGEALGGGGLGGGGLDEGILVVEQCTWKIFEREKN